MGSRHGRKPPYEIMQSVGSGSPLPRSRVRNVRGGSVGWAGMVIGGLTRFGNATWNLMRDVPGLFGRLFSRGQEAGYHEAAAGSGVGGILEKAAEPVQLRVSRWVLALLAVVGLALLGLMFQVGQHVGDRGGATESGMVAEQNPSAGNPDDSDVPQKNDPSTPETAVLARDDASIEPREASGGAVDLTVKPAPVDIPRYDPRAPGRAYLMLATVRPSQIDGIRKLQKFMADHQVATFLDTTNNGQFRVLVDVSRGFTAEEQRAGMAIDHKRKMMLLGQKWKQFNHNRGTDLSDMYWDLYRSPSDEN